MEMMAAPPARRDFAASGTVTSIVEGSEPQIPVEVQKDLEKDRGGFHGKYSTR